MDNSLDITCLCEKSKSTVRPAAEHLLGNIFMCHCNTCRYTSGVLCTTYLTIEPPPRLAPSLTTYQSSKTTERKFCSVCGAHVLDYDATLDEWNVTTGAIEPEDKLPRRTTPPPTRAVRHGLVSDTIDGGLTPCLATNQDHELTYFTQPSDKTPPDTRPPTKDQQPTSSPSCTETLRASCHCGGVQFTLSRPNEKSTQLDSPWPDLLVPYHSSSSENDQGVKWWLRHNATKYLAGTCACRSCRLGSGFPIQTWAFVPRFNINMIVDGESVPLSFATTTKMGTLTRFNSSPGKYREFCGRCGATVFWHCDKRPDLIDVSVGLLRAEEGARAETWLEWWTERVSFKEDAVDEGLIEALEAGLRNIAR